MNLARRVFIWDFVIFNRDVFGAFAAAAMAADKRANSKAFSTAETVVAPRYQTLSEWMDGARRSVRPNGRRPHSLFGLNGLTQPGTCFLRWRAAVSSSKYSVRRPSGLRERGVKTKLMQLSSYLPRTDGGRAGADVGAAANCSRREGRTKTSRVPVASVSSLFPPF